MSDDQPFEERVKDAERQLAAARVRQKELLARLKELRQIAEARKIAKIRRHLSDNRS